METASEVWTIARVRAELPDVDCLLPDGSTVRGGVRGRHNPFAGVALHAGAGSSSSFEFAWTTIVDALNSGRPLRL